MRRAALPLAARTVVHEDEMDGVNLDGQPAQRAAQCRSCDGYAGRIIASVCVPYKRARVVRVRRTAARGGQLERHHGAARGQGVGRGARL